MEVTVMPNAAPAQRTQQQGLNQVVINKVQRMIEGKQPGVNAAITRLLEEGRIAQDFIAPIGANLKKNDRQPTISFSADAHVRMSMPEGNFNLHGNAISQISEKMGVPAKYLRELAMGDEWQKQLCATILNEHSGWTQRTRVLVRAVGMEVRGVLSDSYRRLNSVEIITAFIQEASVQGAVMSDAYMNDTKVWCETILPTPIEIPTRKNGMVTIFAGARFSTSDYGNGSVDMRSFLLNGACLNGMVRESVMRQVHLGSRLPDSIALSQKTYELDTKTTVSAIKDLTKGLYSRETIMDKAIEIQGASEIDVDFDKELKSLVQKGALLKNEGREVEKLLMNNNPDDGVTGGATLWKLTQGITAFAREQEPERSRELHEISGQLMNRVKAN
ncbi:MULTISPECIES: hypothetical protein [unclassified Bacteroides]|uniref:hypothetical protein n=1 Tax=unclassified Bacteroides TaxID=2646097 RepID=UPI000E932257|nr:MULTISPECIES: hypothetical protein [unclassified Bacteroides]RGN59234.1 hypothetical protein DXB58_13920 [Bacteroides sp. OM05-10AA]RGQ65039.1 hypothetical protein DWY87_15190 [Bacteroides sp. AF27-33]